jgi:phage-related protein
VCDTSGNCLVLDVLTTGEQATNAHRKGMLGLLREHVPQYGVPKWPKTRPLGDGLYEFRKQPKRGPKLRVAFFYDRLDGAIIVCTHAFWKDQPSAPAEIERAQRIRTLYCNAQEQGRLRVSAL